jgi:hypothetical protein
MNRSCIGVVDVGVSIACCFFCCIPDDRKATQVGTREGC